MLSDKDLAKIRTLKTEVYIMKRRRRMLLDPRAIKAADKIIAQKIREISQVEGRQYPGSR